MNAARPNYAQQVKEIKLKKGRNVQSYLRLRLGLRGFAF
jgi:hypothetical protein